MGVAMPHFFGLLISCAWCIGVSGTLTSSNSSWPTAVIVYQSGSVVEASAFVVQWKNGNWCLLVGRTDSRSDSGDRKAGHSILDQVWAARAEKGGGLGVLPGVVARMVDAAVGRRWSVSSVSSWSIHGFLGVAKGRATYPAMVTSVSF